MDTDKSINVVLLALTGYGNPVLEALLEDPRVNLVAVFTVNYDRPFPHYEEKQLIELCNERGILCYHGVMLSSDAGIDLLRKHSPDLIVVASFKQILKKNVLDVPRLGTVNFHYSLLPCYRGPCPTNAALFNDEKITGITIHHITEKIDDGNILLQKSMVIDPMDNDGQLRQKLARFAKELVPELVEMFSCSNIPAGVPQNHCLASYAPKPTEEDGYIELTNDIETIQKKMRAFNPIPGTCLLVGNRQIAVDRFELFDIDNSEHHEIFETNDAIDLTIESRTIRLYKKAV